MREHPAVADSLRRWARRFRTATVSTVVAAATIMPAAPSVAAPAPAFPDRAPGATTSQSVTSRDTSLRAPLPAAADGDDSDAGTSTGATTPKPDGHPTEITTVVHTGPAAAADTSTSQAPPAAPAGSGLTRAPPERSALRA